MIELLENLKEINSNFGIGLITENEFKNQTIDILNRTDAQTLSDFVELISIQ